MRCGIGISASVGVPLLSYQLIVCLWWEVYSLLRALSC
jgi:hypothetical protein